MDCSDFRVLASAHLDFELSFAEQKSFLQHLEGCELCARLLAHMQKIKLHLKQGVSTSLSPDFVARLQERLRTDLARRPAWWRRLVEPGASGLSPASLGGLAVAAMAVLAISLSLFRQEEAPLVEPAGQSLQAGPSFKLIPAQPGSVNPAGVADVSTGSDSLLERRNPARRDFSRQMKYVSQVGRP